MVLAVRGLMSQIRPYPTLRALTFAFFRRPSQNNLSSGHSRPPTDRVPVSLCEGSQAQQEWQKFAGRPGERKARGLRF
jgi:hypothetical protein